MKFSAGLVSLLAAAAPSARAAPPGDAVAQLPGYGRPPTPMYSGYLDATDGCPAVNGRCLLHYWLALADDADDRAAPDRDAAAPRPVVLWLNGGPGASSLLGMLQELGPLVMDARGGLMENPWAWTRADAHLLALESPMGVGFSYCSRMVDDGLPCENSDDGTAAANRAALVDFFAKFPELAAGGLYITGESYAGVYLPTLARELLADPAAREAVPLRGVLVGDPCTDGTAQAESMDQLWYAHKNGLVDDEVFAALNSDACTGDFSWVDPPETTTARLPRGTHSSRTRPGGRWSAAVAAAELNAQLVAIADPAARRERAEGLYRERFLGASGDSVSGDSSADGNGDSSEDGADASGDAATEAGCRLAWRKFLLSSSNGLSQGWRDLYIDDYGLFAPVTSVEDEQTGAYLNREDVREALHVAEAPEPWVMVGPRNFTYTKEYNACNWQRDAKFPDTTMVDIYQQILPSLERVWIYNGDADPCVSYEGTREAVKQILAPELDGGSYRPWFYRQEATPLAFLAAKASRFGPSLLAQTLDKPQFAGEVTSYAGGLAFLTVHGSGHMVPQFRPQAALRLLERFLYASGAEGEELTPLLPANATLEALGREDFEAAMDAWTERAMAAADAGRGVPRDGGDAAREIEKCTEECLSEPRASRDGASLDSGAKPQKALTALLEPVLAAKVAEANQAVTSLQVFSNVHFLLVVGGVLLGMAISHFVARRSAQGRPGEACSSSSLLATEATPLRRAGALC